MEFLVGVIALVVGLVIGILVAKLKETGLKSRLAVLSSQLDDARAAGVESLRVEKEKNLLLIREKERAFSESVNAKEAAYNEALNRQSIHHREALEAMQARFDETVAKLKAELSALTSDMLRQRQTEFQTSSAESMSKIIEPLNDSIRRMREAVADNTEKHSKFGGQLSENLRLVLEHSDAARKSAENLARALRSSTGVQGNWGETVLTELLESQGLTQGVHFETQEYLRDAAGNAIKSADDRRMRPDVILHIDRNLDVVIDAKVSMSAYLDFMAAETDEMRENSIKRHLRSIETHVDELVKKDYSSYIAKGRTGVGYVIMFVPNTSALYAAVSRKPDLWRKAMERGVYIADEQTLYAALKIISLTWRQIAQAENHEKVFALANEMLDRVGVFMEKYMAIGAKINDAKKAYDEGLNKLRDSGQSIPLTCRKLVNLGATTKSRKGVGQEYIGLADPTPLFTD